MKRFARTTVVSQILLLAAMVAPVVEGGSRRRLVETPGQGGRAPFAFHYAPSLSAEALAWYSRFDVLVTHDPIPREQVDQLHAAGTKTSSVRVVGGLL